MRAPSTSAVLIAGVIAVGCGRAGSPAAPTPDRPLASSLTPPVGAADASSWTDVLTLPAGSGLGPEALAAVERCVGESVTFVGQDVLIVHRTTLPEGSRLLVVHGDPHGVVAVGGSSGTTYRLAGSDTLARVVAPPGTFAYSFAATVWVIGPGGHPRFGGPVVVHVTVSATGEVTAEIEMFEHGFQCVP